MRAGSSLTRFADWTVVVQDNANYVALIDLQQRAARCLALPPGAGGERVFDRQHGNQDQKLDLEACVTIPAADGPLLLALGSGSHPPRERIVTLRLGRDDEPRVEVYDGGRFYALLRTTIDFAGCALNIEGAAWLGDDTLRLFQRGNGTPRAGLAPIDATCDIAWSALWAHLRDAHAAPPRPANIVQYRLGELGGQRLTFSDAEEAPGGAVLFSASCEGGGSAADGAIGGAALGVIDSAGARWTSLLLDGTPLREKVEGLSRDPDDPHRVYFVVDDDNDAPSELFEVRLSGPWYRSAP